MVKKAIISIDLASMVGSAKLMKLGRALPRDNKSDLELMIANHLLRTIRLKGEHSFEGLRICEQDPPDVLFEYDGVTTGIELTELLPVWSKYYYLPQFLI